MHSHSEKIYFTIKEVSQLLEVPYSYLHYLEKDPVSLPVKKNNHNTRFYSKDNIEYIKKIIFLTRTDGMSLKAAMQKLELNETSVESKIKAIEDLKRTKAFLIELKKQIEES